MWSDKLKLLAILATTKELVSRSIYEGWSGESPENELNEIDNLISFLMGEENYQITDYSQIMFAPTGPINEIASANGWVEIYCMLANEYELLEPKVIVVH